MCGVARFDDVSVKMVIVQPLMNSMEEGLYHRRRDVVRVESLTEFLCGCGDCFDVRVVLATKDMDKVFVRSVASGTSAVVFPFRLLGLSFIGRPELVSNFDVCFPTLTCYSKE